MSEIIQLPEGSGTGGGNWGGIPFSIPVGNFGGYNNGNGFLGGWGGGVLGFLLGAMMNNGGNGFFGGGNNNQTNAMLLSNAQQFLAQGITNQGEATRSAVQSLSTMLGQDFNQVNGDVRTVTQAVNQIAANQGMNALQVVNAIQSGNASLASQLCQCCCQNQKDILQQTNTFLQGMNEGFNGVQQGLSGVQQSIAAKSAADQLARCQQTYALTDTMNRNYLNLDNKIDAMESGRKDREITALTAKVAQLESQNFTAGVLQQALAPVNAQLAGLSKEVDDIKCKMPNTVQVEYPNLVAMNATPYVSGGVYPQGVFGGFGGYGNIAF